MGRDDDSLMRKAKAANRRKAQQGINSAPHGQTGVQPCPGQQHPIASTSYFGRQNHRRS